MTHEYIPTLNCSHSVSIYTGSQQICRECAPIEYAIMDSLNKRFKVDHKECTHVHFSTLEAIQCRRQIYLKNKRGGLPNILRLK